MARQYWLMKTEPDAYSIDDLIAQKQGAWDGVRNYQARNIMRDQMKVGDLVLFYHSNAKPPGVAGIAEVAKEAYPDSTAFDPDAKYFDPKSDPDNPRWFMVEVKFVEKFKELVSLQQLKEDPAVEGMKLIQRGQRLSVQPVAKEHFRHVLKLAKASTKVR